MKLRSHARIQGNPGNSNLPREIEITTSYCGFELQSVFTHVINEHVFKAKKRKRLHKNKVQFPEDYLGHQHGRRSFV